MKGTPRRYARRARPDRRLDVEKNSNPPEAGDRPLGGGPGCYIVRVGADSRVVKKTTGGQTAVVAGEGSPRWTAVLLLFGLGLSADYLDTPWICTDIFGLCPGIFGLCTEIVGLPQMWTAKS